MMRSFLIYLSKADWACQIVTKWKLARQVSGRFVAGEKLEQAIEVVKQLNAVGINATLDHLGERTTNPEHATQATRDILELFDVIDKTGVRSNVSIKLTQIGLALDTALCADNLKKIIEKVKKHNTFLRIDMEDSQWVDKTLELYRFARESCGCENIGVVIQSYLYRSEEDIKNLKKYAARIRLCKGAYKEPEEIAYPKKVDVDANFDRLATLLIQSSLDNGIPKISTNGRIPPIAAIATHDEKRITFAKESVTRLGLPKEAIEFQMLYGIRRDLQERLVLEGYPVRVYVPYGTEWYPYFVRRLAERPANLWFFVSNLFRR